MLDRAERQPPTRGSGTRAIAEIRVGVRFRKDMGDLASLAASIKARGLYHPIVISSDGLLLAGERRLEACKLLGWERVPVTVIEANEGVE
jgi:ParB family chromosome partitioning protein